MLHHARTTPLSLVLPNTHDTNALPINTFARITSINCSNYSQVAPYNRVAFNSAGEAEETGIEWPASCP